MKLRAAVRRLLLLLALASLWGGCGFHLRGEIPGTAQEKTFFISGVGPGNPVYGNLANLLVNSGGILASKPADASAIVNILKVRHIRRPITLSAAGRANMFDLRLLVIYEVQNPKGEVLIPEKELEIRREYFNTQGSPLGQGLEETQLRAEMEKEASQTLLRQVVFSLRDKAGKPS
jgi:LPS-assembly lipoprotein